MSVSCYSPALRVVCDGQLWRPTLRRDSPKLGLLLDHAEITRLWADCSNICGALTSSVERPRRAQPCGSCIPWVGASRREREVARARERREEMFENSPGMAFSGIGGRLLCELGFRANFGQRRTNSGYLGGQGRPNSALPRSNLTSLGRRDQFGEMSTKFGQRKADEQNTTPQESSRIMPERFLLRASFATPGGTLARLGTSVSLTPWTFTPWTWNLLEFAQNGPILSRGRPRLVRHRPANLGRHLPTLARIWPNCAEPH